MSFIHSDVDKLFINFVGFTIDQANLSTNTTGKVRVSTERFCFFPFGGGLGFWSFLNIKLAPFQFKLNRLLFQASH